MSYGDLDALDNKDRAGWKLIDTVQRGGTLGSNDMDEFDEKREYTAVSGDKTCDLISFFVEDYEYLKTRYSKTNTNLLNFLIDNIPELDKALRIKSIPKIDTLFWEEDFQLHNLLT